MDQINDNNYPQWVQRFLDAETTLAEERELYAYFSRPDLPAGAGRYRRMFGWYESLPHSAGTSAATAGKPSPVRILPLRPLQWAGVAAVAAVLLTVGFFMRGSSAADTPGNDYIYDGYIISEGRKITDAETVSREFARREAAMRERFDDIDSRFESMDNYEIYVESDNPEVHDFIRTSFQY